LSNSAECVSNTKLQADKHKEKLIYIENSNDKDSHKKKSSQVAICTCQESRI